MFDKFTGDKTDNQIHISGSYYFLQDQNPDTDALCRSDEQISHCFANLIKITLKLIKLRQKGKECK
jgi:hypothetical protein